MLPELKTFISIVETDNVIKVMENLNLSKATVYEHLKYLEQFFRVNIALISRNNEITITESGNLLYKRAKQIFNIIDDTPGELIENNNDDVVGSIKIGVNSVLEEYFLPKFLSEFLKKYPNIKLVGNSKTFTFLPQFFEIQDLDSRKIEVKEGDILDLGNHKLKFIMAPMVHWPEVMVTYEEKEKTLFSADAFGKFGTLDTIEDWDCEARRYYFNIVGKYGMQVQTLLKKVMNLDIEKICPLHGPTLKENLEHYIEKYNIWSSYKTESEGVYIACASIHGNTYSACEKLKEILEEKGERNVVLVDLSKEDWSEAVEDAFRYGKVVFASSTYNMEIFTPMRNLLLNLKEKNYQNKIVGLIENGTWAPNSAKCMKEILSTMKNMDIIEPVITIKSRLSKENCLQLFEMADDLIKK